MKKLLIFITLITGFVYSQTHQVGSTTLQEREVVGNLDVPWEIKWGPDGYLWITERSGLVSRVNVETGEKHVILNIANTVSTESESGLLGMEFHPDFENNHILFLVYTYYQGWGIKERLVAYTYDESSDSLINEQILINSINGYSTHIGCRLHALDDNTMLMSTGDAQDQSASQDTSELTGKFLRIDISDNNFGGIPADNPINNSYVWSWGHRNAQGLELAPNGLIYSSEHGPQNDDELNILEPNRNYGWPNVNGFCDGFSEQSFCQLNNVVEPLQAWTPTIAPSDIIWYDHPSIPEFQNTLLMTVLKNKMLVKFEFSQDGTQLLNTTEYFNYEWGRLRDICISPDGKIYLATNGNSWPSQGPNEIIELSNPNYDYTSNIKELNNNNKITHSLDFLGRQVSQNDKGWIINIYDNGNAEKIYISN
ncbi:MAG: glucose dehydrogenase [Flavobacteriales bacterium]|nr:glucose dehydrogenase [Flavobacteriales bacterium]|tara:strand:- start:41053 stop:42324 length:1272 start_codon:yes stop_codon:yes gene_type:complete